MLIQIINSMFDGVVWCSKPVVVVTMVGDGWGWMGLVGIVGMDEVVGFGYTRKRWIGCQQVGNKSNGGGWSGWGGCSWISRMSSGFDMTGFYWDLEWLHQTVIKPPGYMICGGSGGGGQFGTRCKPWFCCGNWGGWWFRWWIQWCWLLVEWMSEVLGWFPNQNVVWAFCNECFGLRISWLWENSWYIGCMVNKANEMEVNQ